MLTRLWSLRIISGFINTLERAPVLIQFDRNLPEGTFFSTSRGSPKIRVLTAFIPGIAIGMLVITISLGTSVIFQKSHLLAWSYVLLYTLLGSMLLFSLIGAFVDLKQNFDEYLVLSRNFAAFPTQTNYLSALQKRGRPKAIVPWLLPRGKDVMLKGPAFFLGCVFANVVVGLADTQVATLNVLFLPSGGRGWDSPASIPIWPILALALLGFFVEELLLQQGKLIWDDIRDRDLDAKRGIHHKTRPIASGKLSLGIAKVNALLRVVVALAVAHALAGPVLLVLFVVICVIQAVYEFVAKPFSNKYPYFPGLCVATNLPLRFLCGATLIARENWLSDIRFWLAALILYLMSYSEMSLFWAIEARDFRPSQPVELADSPTCSASFTRPTSRNQSKSGKADLSPRPQSATFLAQGEKLNWQFARAATVIAAALVWGQLSVDSRIHSWSDLVTTECLFSANMLLSLVILMVIQIGLVCFSRKPRESQSPWTHNPHFTGFLGSLGLGFALPVIALLFSDRQLRIELLLFALLFLAAAHLLQSSEQTFDELNLSFFGRNLSLVVGLWGHYIFSRDSAPARMLLPLSINTLTRDPRRDNTCFLVPNNDGTMDRYDVSGGKWSRSRKLTLENLIPKTGEVPLNDDDIRLSSMTIQHESILDLFKDLSAKDGTTPAAGTKDAIESQVLQCQE